MNAEYPRSTKEAVQCHVHHHEYSCTSPTALQFPVNDQQLSGRLSYKFSRLEKQIQNERRRSVWCFIRSRGSDLKAPRILLPRNQSTGYHCIGILSARNLCHCLFKCSFVCCLPPEPSLLPFLPHPSPISRCQEYKSLLPSLRKRPIHRRIQNSKALIKTRAKPMASPPTGPRPRYRQIASTQILRKV